MQSTHHTGEGEGESRREKRGRATGQRETGPLTHSETHSHTRTYGSRRTHAAPTGRDFYRGSGTNVGLAVLGCSKVGSLLSLSGGAVTLGDVGVSGVSFQTPAKSDCCV